MSLEAVLANGLGVVVIGRNEGDRLSGCLESVTSEAAKVVYVDSGSTDNSLETARRLGAEVVELDMSIPFCAARARNAGYQRLVETCPQVSYVQFVDGDCELVDGWLSLAVESLQTLPDHAIVTGWLREKSPDVSIYNRLGDLEWNFAGAGPVDAVGGIFMIRREVFDMVGGFDPTLAAGEEPELCQRITRKGWRLVKLDREMARHDLAMSRFGQWWRRMVRNGYGGMDVAHRFGVAKFVRMTWRARAWSIWLVLLVALGTATGAMYKSSVDLLPALVLFGLWPAQLIRIALRTLRDGHPLGTSIAYAFFTAISFAPQIAGQMLYFSDRLRNRSFRLVEYKGPVSSTGKRSRLNLGESGKVDNP
jgi:glycosyltransferase involved in cell wall biosynthesis